jgi:hypothetical protein
VFHDLKNVKIAEKSLKIGQLLPILANFSHNLWSKNHVLKKVPQHDVGALHSVPHNAAHNVLLKNNPISALCATLYDYTTI